MKIKPVKYLLICMLCLLMVTPAVFAGEGLYPSKSAPKETIMPTDEVPPIIENGQTCYWSEQLGKYIPEKDIKMNMTEGPGVTKEWITKNLQPAPSKKNSVQGEVKKDTLIYSGPSIPSKIFEDNGTIKGSSKLFIFHEENGYYFVENKDDGVRGYLPKDEVIVKGTLKDITKQNVIAAAVSVNALGITKKSSGSFITYNVYSQMNESSTYKIGSIGSTSAREIVQVVSSDTVSGVQWYYIQYKTSSGYKNGYIKASNIYIPGYGYSKPISSGTFTNDYKSSHAGVDIGGNGIAVKTIGSGTLKYKVSYKMMPNNILTFVSYGRHATITTSNGTFLYAHLGSYSYDASVRVLGYDGQTYYTYQLKNNNSMLGTAAESASSSTKTVTATFADGTQAKTLSSGASIGASGWTGNVSPSGSGGAHLHFEVTSASSGNKDPFNYVLFPGVCYLGSTV